MASGKRTQLEGGDFTLDFESTSCITHDLIAGGDIVGMTLLRGSTVLAHPTKPDAWIHISDAGGGSLKLYQYRVHGHRGIVAQPASGTLGLSYSDEYRKQRGLDKLYPDTFAGICWVPEAHQHLLPEEVMTSFAILIAMARDGVKQLSSWISTCWRGLPFVGAAQRLSAR